ncbi:MAG: T9SS type A sorting domain-containing protein [Candidatus Eiseniibacteriota bacterium]
MRPVVTIVFALILASAGASKARGDALVRPFTLFGWSAPPVEEMNAARVAEYANAGLDLMLPSITDSGRVSDNLDRLEWAAASGVRCLLWDRRFRDADGAFSGSLDRLDSIVTTYRNHPAFAGYYLGDEPDDSLFDQLGDLFGRIRALDAEHPCWNNLLPRSGFATREEWIGHMRRYVERVQPSVLSNAQYDLLLDRDRGQLVENVFGTAALAREYGLPFWGIVQVIGHGGLRSVTAGELSWQVGTWLSYGARGIGYFVYWEHPTDSVFFWGPGMISRYGFRTVQYDRVRELNQVTRPVGEALAGLTWRSTQYAGSVPAGGTAFVADKIVRAVEGRAAIGRFEDGAGDPYVFVLNSDSSRAQEIVLRLDPSRRDSSVTLSLGPGAFSLLRLERTSAPPPSGLRIDALPNPARGTVRFRVLAGEPTRLEIMSLSGRVLWRAERSASGPDPEWHGETTGGAVAPAGLYFVRVVGRSGVATRRIVWMGPE